MKLVDKIAEGKEREVYRHPFDPGRIVKVMKPGHDTHRWNRNHGELQYYERLNEKQKARLAKLFGLLETDRGPGSVAEYIQDHDGTPSRPLHLCVEDGRIDVERAEAMLAEFFDWADCHAVALVTANIDNFLCRFDGNGNCRLVMIDGFGPASMTIKWRLRLLVPTLVRLRTATTRRRVMRNWQAWRAGRAG